jgi:hypothetical protein
LPLLGPIPATDQHPKPPLSERSLAHALILPGGTAGRMPRAFEGCATRANL